MNQSVQVVMMIISSALYSGLESELKSDPLKVSLSPSPCVDDLYQDCKITLSLQNTVDYGLSKLKMAVVEVMLGDTSVTASITLWIVMLGSTAIIQ